MITLENLSPLESYRLMTSAIIPRPIAFVTTLSREGKTNGAPFSYFQGITSNPQLVMLSIGRRKGIPKDTLRNIESTGEFVINLVTEEILEKVVQTSADYPYGVSELEEVGLQVQQSSRVKPPLVLESPVNLECRLLEIVVLGKALQNMVIGEVVCYHIREDLLQEDGTIDPFSIHPVGRLGGSYYCKLGEIFEIPRPVLE
ncbi:MAG: flavin reductase family protein [Planctomycetota bacterium]|nr:MAG: flavin reductase family protein [Planctomycetota bacterium]